LRPIPRFRRGRNKIKPEIRRRPRRSPECSRSGRHLGAEGGSVAGRRQHATQVAGKRRGGGRLAASQSSLQLGPLRPLRTLRDFALPFLRLSWPSPSRLGARKSALADLRTSYCRARV